MRAARLVAKQKVAQWCAQNSRIAMAEIIDGKAIAARLDEQTKAQVDAMVAAGQPQPGLTVILLGDDPASQIYVRHKIKACARVGIHSAEHRLPASTTQEELLALIERLNAEKDVHGILCQVPLPPHINPLKVLGSIAPGKDVDGFHPVNVGRLSTGTGGIIPCTPLGVMMLIDSVVDDLTGKDVVVIGKSNIVGKPVANLLLDREATVTVTHIHTAGLKDIARKADVIVAAAGAPRLVKGDWVKPGAVIIDVGITRVKGEDGKDRLVGDVAFDEVQHAAAVTPVPGGVGPMTIACLLANTVRAAQASFYGEVATSDPVPCFAETQERRGAASMTGAQKTKPDVDVLIVGAGISGISMAAHMALICPDRTYAIYERRAALGGTWDLFRYPGVRSDSDMHTLGFVFEPWTHDDAIADGPAILEYLHRTADERGIAQHIRFSSEVLGADWNAARAHWVITTRHADGTDSVTTARWLYFASGYYDYDEPHDAQLPGLQNFGGRVVHPQFWPADLDYVGKNVVVIGSGATAVTLVPAMADKAASVTMLQRTPTWMASGPRQDKWAQRLRQWLPEKLAYFLTRQKNIMLRSYFFGLSRRNPKKLAATLRRFLRKNLGEAYTATDWEPPYDPWRQRLCLVPDGDMFAAVRSGTAQVVTDQIDTFTQTGVRLASDRELPADIVVTATGLRLVLTGKVALSLDGEALDLANHYFYRGTMFSNVPNLAVVFGYLNASWTLRADNNAAYIARVLNELGQQDELVACPVLAKKDEPAEVEPFDYSSGYLQRARGLMPKSGAQLPWRLNHDYLGRPPRFSHPPCMRWSAAVQLAAGAIKACFNGAGPRMMAEQKRIWTAGMVVIGDEILSGRTQDANIGQVARWLQVQGIRLVEARVISDDMDAIVAAVNELRVRHDYLFTTGGIGPTHDDITVDAIAAALGTGVIIHPEARAMLHRYYSSKPGGLTEGRLRMARVPDGAQLIPNHMSGAPGIQIGNIFMMAGVPHITAGMLDALTGTLEGGAPLQSETLGCWVAESEVAEMLRNVEAAHEGAQIGSYPFFREGRVGANFVIRSTDHALLSKCTSGLSDALAAAGFEVTPGGI